MARSLFATAPTSAADEPGHLTGVFDQKALVIDPMRHRFLFARCGMPLHVLRPQTPMRIATATADGAELLSPGVQMPLDRSQLGELLLCPQEMKAYKKAQAVTNELAYQLAVSTAAGDAGRYSMFLHPLASALTRAIEQRTLSDLGDGVTEPQGMFAWTGRAELAVDGPITFDHIMDANAAAISAGSMATDLVWVMNPETLTTLKKSTDFTGHYQPLVSGSSNPDGFTPTGQPGEVSRAATAIDGVPVAVTGNIQEDANGATRAVLIDRRNVVFAWEEPRGGEFDQTLAQSDQLLFTSIMRADAGMLAPGAVTVLTGITNA